MIGQLKTEYLNFDKCETWMLKMVMAHYQKVTLVYIYISTINRWANHACDRFWSRILGAASSDWMAPMCHHSKQHWNPTLILASSYWSCKSSSRSFFHSFAHLKVRSLQSPHTFSYILEHDFTGFAGPLSVTFLFHSQEDLMA